MSPSELWLRTLAIIKKAVNPQTYDAWFQPTRCVAYSAEGVRIQVPNQFFADWLRDNHLPLIQKSLGQAMVDAARDRLRSRTSGYAGSPSRWRRFARRPRTGEAILPVKNCSSTIAFSFPTGASNQFATRLQAVARTRPTS
jgi:chromosomal replication initiator protein